jgi:hypothetical protein
MANVKKRGLEQSAGGGSGKPVKWGYNKSKHEELEKHVLKIL